MTVNSSLTLRLLTGPSKDAELRLTGRALPIGPLPLQGKMRAEVTYAAGNPNATLQLLGAEEGETSLEGVWRQRYLGGEDFAWWQGDAVNDVAELADIVDDIRRTGALVALTWAHIKRVGYVSGFVQRWLAADEVEWSLDITFTGRVDPALLTPPVIAQRGGVEDIASATADDVAALGAAANAPPALTGSSSPSALLSVAQGYLDDLNDAIGDATSYVTALTDTAEQAASLAVRPLEAANRAVGCLQGFVGSALYLSTVTTAQIQAQIQVDTYTRQGQRIAALLWADGIARDSRAARRRAAKRQAELERRTAGVVIAAHLTRQGDDLRRISLRYYGTQDRWREIATYNGIQGSAPAIGTVVYIPQVQEQAV